MPMKKSIGTRIEVMNNIAKKTSGGLTKKDLKYKDGKIISRKASNSAIKRYKMNGGLSLLGTSSSSSYSMTKPNTITKETIRQQQELAQASSSWVLSYIKICEETPVKTMASFKDKYIVIKVPSELSNIPKFRTYMNSKLDYNYDDRTITIPLNKLIENKKGRLTAAAEGFANIGNTSETERVDCKYVHDNYSDIKVYFSQTTSNMIKTLK